MWYLLICEEGQGARTWENKGLTGEIEETGRKKASSVTV